MYSQFKYNKETNTFEIPSQAMWLFLKMDKELELLEETGSIEYVDEEVYTESNKYANRIMEHLKKEDTK